MAETNVGQGAPSPFSGGEFGLPSLQPPEEGTKPVTIQTAGTATTAGAYQESSIQESEQKPEVGRPSSANVEPSNPSMVPPDATTVSADEEAVSPQVNAFLSNIYAVALEVVMAAIVKISSYHERVDSQSYLNMVEERKEMAEEKAEFQLEKGKLEMYTSFAKALCCAAQVGISAGTAVGNAWKGPRTATGAAIQSTGQALSGIAGQESITSNLVQGVSAYEQAKIDASMTMLDYSMQLANETSDRIEQDRKDTADLKNQMLQSYMQWINNLYALTSRG